MDDLIDWAKSHARRDDPQTSKDAAAQSRGLAGEHCRLILGALGYGPGTAEEIAYRMRYALPGIQAHQVNRRTGELLAAGLIELTGETRPSQSGRQMRVFRKVG